MMFTAHPDLMLQLAKDRVASLQAEAEAERHRRSRRPLPRWRPARFVDPAPDLSRAAPPTEADRAA